jgi:hypothetical protein
MKPRDYPLVSVQPSGDLYLNRQSIDLASKVFGVDVIGERVVILVDEMIGVTLLELHGDGWVLAKKLSGAGVLSKAMKRKSVMIPVGHYHLASVDVPDNGLTLPGFAWTDEGVEWIADNASESHEYDGGT